jgi:flagellar hook-associated protein 2
MLIREGSAMASTYFLSGLSSGLDWQSMITQLVAIERQPEQLLTNQKTTLNNKYKEWGVINTKLSALQTSASSLAASDSFNLYTTSSSVTGTSTDVSKLASFAVGSNASPGSYSLTINNLAQAQKLGSRSFSSLSDGLNISGDLVINGHTINIASTDSLTNIQNKINALNSGQNPAGVTASIITVASGQYQLTLTSQNTGKNGMILANGSSTDVLGMLGVADNSTSLRYAVTGGAQSSAFSSSTESIKGLLGLTTGSSGTVTIAGVGIAIDLSSNSLEDIKNTINGNLALQAAGVSASIVPKTSSGNTTYTLQINGTQTFVDSGNILQTLGVLKQGNSAVSGVIGGTQNTSGGSAITSDTLITSIDGYNTWTTGDKITIGGADHNGTAITSTDFTITSTSTVGDLLSAIQTAFGSQVSAYVNSNGAIVVEDNQTGASSLALSLTPSNSDLDFGTFNTSSIRKREIVAGEDAQIILDGTTITRSTNQITDVISGTTINLLGEDAGATITLNITQDYSGIESKISDFVKKYNDLMTEINAQFTYTQDSSSSTTQETPPLFADSTLQTIKGTIRNTILSGVSGVDSSLDHLSLVGINLDKTGMLSVDSNKLEGYLKTNFSDVVNLFAAQGTSTNSNLTYVGSTNSTVAGAYQVEITQAATKAGTTGSGFSGTLSGDTSFTITDSSGRTALISLLSGSNISTIINTINSELSKEYQQILVGANRLYADAGQTSAISTSTTLDSIFDASGASANLANGDEITFSGTDRAGNAVSGSFTISDSSTQTVGNLLNTISEAYGSGYSVSIDAQGRITITDSTNGDSKLSLNIDTVKNLDFGTIDVDPTGADGSQSGRFAMGITAENVGGQLKLTRNDYGNYSFTIADGLSLGLTDGIYTGNDVAGRIKLSGSETWMTMVGSGQTLTGNADQDVEGLVINYTGTSTGTFDFNFTKGVGDMLDKALDLMSDSVSGYVSKKQQSLQNQMSDIDNKIADMEERITRYQETLTSKFVAMETAISKLQSMQTWLTSQINSLYNYNNNSSS